MWFSFLIVPVLGSSYDIHAIIPILRGELNLVHGLFDEVSSRNHPIDTTIPLPNRMRFLRDSLNDERVDKELLEMIYPLVDHCSAMDRKVLFGYIFSLVGGTHIEALKGVKARKTT